MVYAADLKFADREIVWVRLPPRAQTYKYDIVGLEFDPCEVHVSKLIALDIGRLEVDPADLILAILMFCQDMRLQRPLEVSDFDLHMLIFGLRERYQDSMALEPFVFSETGPAPFSPILQRSLETLKFSGLISRPDLVNKPDQLVVHENGRRWFKEISQPLLSRGQIEDCKIAAAEISKAVSYAGWRG